MSFDEDQFPIGLGERLKKTASSNARHWVKRVLSENPSKRVAEHTARQILKVGRGFDKRALRDYWCRDSEIARIVGAFIGEAIFVFDAKAGHMHFGRWMTA
ncbi:hypothetical protein AYM40_15730 [Paraburkholderia phytofirmans OLGA172]|uniref:Uncharacterized protein n=1 Tax=Paraburkholderia phytofirmans OLGA172 TaxID=1417228 RepID=A0A160FM48_9BURK|nr:hypothetical protein [Paraburkholderia phytofirmans]ANB73645.1 hypothetical protein AYM40_15730 [Paraburkholderia phytofirmans OLGA172]